MAREAIKSYPMGINTSFFSCVKRKFRFLFEIQGITDISNPLVALPAQKATRPTTFFEKTTTRERGKRIFAKRTI